MMKLKKQIAKERAANKRANLQEGLWDSQIDFGMFKTIEVAEASSQLLLSVMLIATKFEVSLKLKYYTNRWQL